MQTEDDNVDANVSFIRETQKEDEIQSRLAYARENMGQIEPSPHYVGTITKILNTFDTLSVILSQENELRQLVEPCEPDWGDSKQEWDTYHQQCTEFSEKDEEIHNRYPTLWRTVNDQTQSHWDNRRADVAACLEELQDSQDKGATIEFHLRKRFDREELVFR